MQDEPLGRQAGRQWQLDIGRLPALAVHPQRGMGVLSNGLRREPADRIQRGAPDHGAGAAEERSIPKVVAVLQQAVEHVAFGRHPRAGRQISLERIRRIEMMRRLHERQLRSRVSQPIVICRNARVGM